MFSLILIPFVLLLFLLGLIFFLIGRYQSNSGLKKLFIGLSYVLWLLPLIFILIWTLA